MATGFRAVPGPVVGAFQLPCESLLSACSLVPCGSTAFRAEVLERCLETLQSNQSASNQPTARAMEDEVATCWENVREELSVQMHDSKRNAKVVQQRRGRRRLRAEKVS